MFSVCMCDEDGLEWGKKKHEHINV